MNIAFTARRVKLDPRVRELVEGKLTKLSRVLPSDAQAHVIVQTEKKGVSVEVTVVGRQRTWTATEAGVDQEIAVHAVLERIEAQARKARSKVTEDKKHRGPRARAAWLEGDGRLAPEAAPASSARAARRSERVKALPMFEEDALSEFAGSEKDVLIYRDAGDETLRVLYRRRNGNVGLLIPV